MVTTEALTASDELGVPFDLVELHEVLEWARTVAAGPGEARAAAVGPTQFLTRAQLGLRAPQCGYSRITAEGITIHYAGPSPWGPAGIGSHDRCASIWRGFQAYHMDANHWCDIAYTGGVCPHGVRFEGRPAWARTAAQGTNDGNDRSLAACYIAGAGDPLTDEAKVAFCDEADRLGAPLRWGHRDWHSTDCPGEPEYAWKTAGFSRPGGVPVPVPPPVLPPRKVSTITLAADVEDEGPMERRTFDCGTLDGDGHGSVLFDGGANGDPRIMHFEAIPYAAMRGLWAQGSYPPVDGNRGLPVAGPQERDGFLCVEFDGGPPRGPVTLLVDVAT